MRSTPPDLVALCEGAFVSLGGQGLAAWVTSLLVGPKRLGQL